MKQRSDTDRVLRHWMSDGPSTMPDRVIDIVADRISRQPQRRTWRFPERATHMNRSLLFVAAIAAALVVAVVGWNLLPRSEDVGGTPPPSPSPVTTAPPPLPGGSLAAGTYRLSPLASVPSLRIDAQVPDGWQGFGSWAILGPSGTDAPGGIGIAFIKTDGIFRDPCHWDVKGDGSWPQSGDATVGPTVDDLANALIANTSYVSTTPADTTLGGHRGKQLDLQLPSDIAGCDRAADGPSRYMVFGGIDGGLYAQGPGNRMRVSILDVAGTRLLVVTTSYAATTPADRSAAQAIIESLVITP